jgi:hypothetical protein
MVLDFGTVEAIEMDEPPVVTGGSLNSTELLPGKGPARHP